MKRKSSLGVRKYFFPQMTVNEWNKLSADGCILIVLSWDRDFVYIYL